MTTFQRNKIIFTILWLFDVSCAHNKDYSATMSCNNLKFHAHTIFPNESIMIKFNKEVIFEKIIKSEQEGYYVDKNFCLPYAVNCTLNVTSFLNSKKYIDTTFTVKDLNIGYHLVISMPHPINWKEYYKDGIPYKEWGYLSIDSCIRFVRLIPDSLYNNTIEL